MASAIETASEVFLEIMPMLERLTPMEKLRVLERLLGSILCADFKPEHEADILRDIARRVTAVNAQIRKQLEQEAARAKPRGPGTAH